MSELFRARSHPANLAMLRIVVFGLLLIDVLGPAEPVWFALLPEQLRVPPPGWEGFFHLVPLDPVSVVVAKWLFVVACLFALFGAYTRPAATCAVVLGVYVLGVPQFFGKLNHDHHLLWFAALLAASRSGDALSIDQWRRRTRPAPDVAYGLPLRMCWVLVGMIYLFPGLWKAWVIAPEWIGGDALVLHMHEKWLELGDYEPLIRVDLYPKLSRVAAAGVILFELTFLPALLFPRIRRFAVLSGLLFHAATFLIMDIHFVRLVACYVMFLDVEPLARRFGPWDGPLPGRRPVAPVVTGVLLIVMNGYCGFAGVDSWPVAVYPRFHYQPRPQRAEIVLHVTPADGSPAYVAAPAGIKERMHSSRWVRMLRRISSTHGAQGRALGEALIEVFRANGLDLAPGDRITLLRELSWTDPDRRADNPVHRVRVAEIVVE